jgi:glycosyltransferase involved in cell wall biosynthesis
MIYIEPTPYIAALIGKLRRIYAGRIEVYYVTTNFSQSWKLQLDCEHECVLPTGRFARWQALYAVLSRDRRRTLLHLAGWGHSVLLGAMIMAAALRIPVAVETDTAEGRLDRPWRDKLKKLLYPLLFRLPRRFLPGGTRQARYLMRYGVTRDRMTIVEMTVDVCAIRRFCERDRTAARAAMRAHWGITAAERVVLFVGRLESDKGLPQLLSAFDQAITAESDLRLVIAGDGSLRARVEAIAAPDEHRVTYIGRLSAEDVLRAYCAADCVVLPSLFEPWGLVVNEAMACGVPVIVSDQVGCIDDLVRPGETGLVVGAGREAELISAILQLVRDAPGRSRMGRAAERAISHWTLGNEARNIVSAWDEMAR